MDYQGTAKLDRRTKNLVKRLNPADIAFICHHDLDRVTAESLIEAKTEVVINAESFSTGRYPNIGPLILLSAGIHLVDKVGPEIFDTLNEGERITIRDGKIFKNGQFLAEGEVLSLPKAQNSFERAEKSLGKELEKFALNTLSYIQKEKNLLLDGVGLPETRVKFLDRQALVVARGYHYKEDIKILWPYIREVRPVLIGVDGGSDALISEGLKPDIIIGDMDSVSDRALLSGAELIVHAYPNGKAPGLKRLEKMGLKPLIFKTGGTSEDIALLLAYEKGADLIVAVGTHSNLIEFLDKGRGGMASTFLTRLRVGDRLVDAKGVNKLYRARVKTSHILTMLVAALVAMLTVILVSPPVKQFISLIFTKLRLLLGF